MLLERNSLTMASPSAANLPSLQQPTKFVASSSLKEVFVLQSDPVRRLFNQPNIVIHAIPRTNSPTAYRVIKPKPASNNKNGINGEYQLPNKPDMSIQVLNTPSKETSNMEKLLPFKNNEKSDIILVPVVRHRKECGHFEPCESLVCDVFVQQYEDHEEITPLISVNIDEVEIDATVGKHCQNNKCDALSIDHNHCRRVSIQLTHCDKCIMCDICGITFRSRKARLNHKKCRRKNVYTHNTATPSDIFKYRMRERELQLLEAARLKRSSDYLDPITGFSRTMQALTKNDELIIIPKMAPSHSKAFKPTFASLNYNKNNNIGNSTSNNENNSIKNILGNKKPQHSDNRTELTNEKLTSIILSCQKSINAYNKNENNNSLLSKQIKLSDHLNGATIDIRKISNLPNQKKINVTGLSLNNLNSTSVEQQQPPSFMNSNLLLNNINFNLGQQQRPITITGVSSNIKNFKVVPISELKSEPSLLHHTQGMPKFCVVPDNLPQPCKTPFKVVPIAELKSEPSLLHQTQGLPKFCVVPDTSTVMQTTQHYPQKKLNQKERKQSSLLLLPKLVPKTTQLLNSSKFHPLQPTLSSVVQSAEVKIGDTVLTKKQKTRKRPRKKLLRKGKFRCTHCPKRFTSIDYCRIHIAKHENNPGFFCKLCEKGFLNKYVMKKHLDTEHKAGEVRCEMCNCILSSVQELLNHMKSPETKVKQQCPDCCESFDTCSSLDVHMRKEHGFLICTLCKRQVTKTKMKKHLMLEHSISKNRAETAFDKLSYLPSENVVVCEVNFPIENAVTLNPVVKTEPVNETKVELDCLARNRSVRRRSSKEFFTCNVCERRFENEKQFQIHLANNPMKFTLCPDCGKKFHRKSEYTEHSKTCGWKIVSSVEQTPKRRKLSQNNEPSLKSNITFQNSIDEQLKEKLKSNAEKIVQKEDNGRKSILKSTVETKIVNGLKQDSSDCSEMLKVTKESENIKKKEDSECIKHNDKEVVCLNAKETEMESKNSTIFDKSIAVTNIFRDHNYLALQ